MQHTRQRAFKRVLVLALVVASFSLGAALTHAKGHGKKGPAATILAGDALCTKTASHGKAWITELARGENAFVGRLGIAPGAKVPEHRDETEEYIHVLSGHGKITVDGKTTDIGPGSAVFMPARAKVSFENGDETMTVLQVFAGPGPAKKYAGWAGCKG
jgi:quercetin dioxygenase-like cupin family protein